MLQQQQFLHECFEHFSPPATQNPPPATPAQSERPHEPFSARTPPPEDSRIPEDEWKRTRGEQLYPNVENAEPHAPLLWTEWYQTAEQYYANCPVRFPGGNPFDVTAGCRVENLSAAPLTRVSFEFIRPDQMDTRVKFIPELINVQSKTNLLGAIDTARQLQDHWNQQLWTDAMFIQAAKIAFKNFPAIKTFLDENTATVARLGNFLSERFSTKEDVDTVVRSARTPRRVPCEALNSTLTRICFFDLLVGSRVGLLQPVDYFVDCLIGLDEWVAPAAKLALQGKETWKLQELSNVVIAHAREFGALMKVRQIRPSTNSKLAAIEKRLADDERRLDAMGEDTASRKKDTKSKPKHNSKPYCKRCNKRGHKIADCPFKDDDADNGSAGRQNDKRGGADANSSAGKPSNDRSTSQKSNNDDKKGGDGSKKGKGGQKRQTLDDHLQDDETIGVPDPPSPGKSFVFKPYFAEQETETPGVAAEAKPPPSSLVPRKRSRKSSKQRGQDLGTATLYESERTGRADGREVLGSTWILGDAVVDLDLDTAAGANIMTKLQQRQIKGQKLAKSTDHYTAFRGISTDADVVKVVDVVLVLAVIGAVRREILFHVVDQEDWPPCPIIGYRTLKDMRMGFAEDPDASTDQDNGDVLILDGQTCHLTEHGTYVPDVFRFDQLPSVEIGDEDAELLAKADDSCVSSSSIPKPPPMAAPPEGTGRVFAATAYDNLDTDIDIDAVGTPRPANLEPLGAPERARFRKFQRVLVSLSDIHLDGAKAPEQFRYKFVFTEDAPERMVERHRQHGAANNRHFSAFLKDNLASGVIELVPADELGDMTHVTNHCFPSNDLKTRTSIVAEMLNKYTVAEPLQRFSIDDFMRSIDRKDANIFSVIDIRWAFNLIEIHPDHRKFTNFYGNDGQYYRYKRMPFGLRNAPTYFMRWIATVLAELPFVRVYVDDIVIVSPDAKTHLDHLEQLAEVLKENNIPVRYQKIKLFQSETIILGHRWSEGGVVEPNYESIQTIEDMTQPTTGTQMMRFIGLVRWVAEFTKGIARPLSELQKVAKKSNKKIKWNETLNKAFDDAKEACKNYFKTSLITYTPDEYGNYEKFKVYTDASDWGMGAALFQGNRLIRLYSYAWKAPQLKWSTINQEAFAIVKTLGRWKSILMNQHFELYTDHKPLLWLIQSSADGKGSAMNERWMMALRAFSFQAHHISGEKNILADGQSRAPFVREDGEKPPKHELRDTAVIFTTMSGVKCNIADAAQSDKRYRALLLMAMDDDFDPHSMDSDHEFFELKSDLCRLDGRDFAVYDDKLIRRIDGSLSFSIVVPESHTVRAIKIAHGHYHGGSSITYLHLRRHYWWIAMHAQVRKYVSGCDVCQRMKPSRSARRTIKPWNPVPPMARWHTDLVDMSSTPSAAGHRYIAFVVDAGSRFVVLSALHSKTKEEHIRFLLDAFGYLGTPDQLVYDRGTENVNDLHSELLEKARVLGHAIPPHAHRSNGAAEIVVKAIRNRLKYYTRGRQNWNIFTRPVQRDINSTTSTTTGYTPSEIMLGRRFDKNAEYEDVVRRYSEMHGPDEYIDMIHRLQSEALDKRTEANETMARHFDNRHAMGETNAQDIKVGSVVLADLRDKSAGRKQRFYWSEKAKVTKIESGTYHVKFADGTIKPFPIDEIKLHVPSMSDPDDDDDPSQNGAFGPDPSVRIIPADNDDLFAEDDFDYFAEPLVVGPSSVSPNHQSAASPVALDDGQFYLENIVGARGQPGDNRSYRVKWEGYGPEHNTWQPEQMLTLESIEDALTENPQWMNYMPTDRITFPLQVEEVASIVSYSNGILKLNLKGDIAHMTVDAPFEFISERFFSDSSLFADAKDHLQARNAYTKWRKRQAN
jgi:hypothetical protein